jgi:hypothetical protein
VKAIRVKRRCSGSHYTMHWLTDDEETVCRLATDDLDVVDDLDIEKLPPLEACGSCRRIVDGWSKPLANIDPDYRPLIIASPAPGRIRTTGSLYHGTRVSRGSRIA